MKKKLLFMMLGALTALPSIARDFKYTYEGQTITYTVIDEDAKTVKTLEGVSGKPGNNVSGDLILPEHPMDGEVEYTLTEIGEYAFYDCSGLTSVIIPNSVTTISGLAFEECSRLSEITIPISVTSIGERAFRRCSRMTSVIIGNSVTTIGDLAFEECSRLTSAIIGDSVTSIGGGAFAQCSGLTSVIIPNSVTSIGGGAFSQCSGLTSVIIGNSVTTIGGNAFYGCSGLTSVIIPNSVISIDEGAFYESGLTSVIIPKSVTYIGTSIGREPFYACPLRKAAYPNTLQDPFMRFNITIMAYNPEGDEIEDGWIYGPDKSAILFAPLTLEGEYTVPNSVTAIGDGAFDYCSGLTSVIIPNSVTKIGSRAFAECSGLTSVIIPNSVTSIGGGAFAQCSGLVKSAYPNTLQDPFWHGTTVAYNPKGAEIEDGWIYGPAKSAIIFAPLTLEGEYTVPNSVTSIGERAFQSCSGLNELTIPNSVTEIGEDAFKDCSALTEINALGVNPAKITNSFTDLYTTSILTVPSDGFNNYLATNWSRFENIKVEGSDVISATFNDGTLKYRLNPTDMTAVVTGASTKTVTIPERFTDDSDPANPVRYYVKAIGYAAFQGFNFESFEFNPRNELEVIGNYAFNKSNLSSITLPSTVKSIGNRGFAETKISEITIPELVSQINDSTFYSCADLKKVTFESSVETIGADAFAKCINLADFPMDKVTNSIGDNAFLKCRSLADIAFNDNLQSIGSSAFEECLKLHYIAFNDNLQSIGSSAFYNTNLTSVTIPTNIQSIGQSAFAKCTELKSMVVIDSDTPLTLGKNLIRNSSVESLYIGRNFNTPSFSQNQALKSLAIGNTVTELIDDAFKGCNRLETLTLGSRLKTIGANCFSGTALTEVVVGPSVETIGESAFAANSKLESIIMGSNVKTIGEKAFDGCPASTVSITAQTPPTAPNNTFSNYTGKLFLQGKEAIDAYYDAYTCWDRFNSYEMIVPTELIIDGNKKISGKPGDTFQLGATLLPEDVTLTQVFWHSTNPEIATVDNNGLVTLHTDMSELMTLADGDNQTANGCAIIAESLYANGPVAQVSVEASADIEVTGISLDKDKATVTEGEILELIATIAPDDATDKTVTWTTSDESVATVEDGKVSALKPGVATITATASNDMSASCTVTVEAKVIEVENITLSANELTLTEGDTKALTASVTPDDATDKTVTWTTSDESVATVEDGKVSALKPGVAIITATASNDMSASCTVTVEAKVILVSEIILTPDRISEEEGMTVQIVATVLPDDATNATLEWTSSNENVAKVDQNGLVTIISEGSADITATATDGSGIYAICPVEGLSGIESLIVNDVKADVYTPNGLLIKKNADREFITNLAKGIYILKISGKTYKVVK